MTTQYGTETVIKSSQLGIAAWHRSSVFRSIADRMASTVGTSQAKFTDPPDPQPQQSWLLRIGKELEQVCTALGTSCCGWLCDFLPQDSRRGADHIGIRVFPIGIQRTLVAYNTALSPAQLSAAEMTQIISYQNSAWTPNVQKWPLTIWNKATQEHRSGLTVCIPLHGPYGTTSVVFVPLADGVKDWYSTALHCVGPLLATEHALRSIFDQSRQRASSTPDLSSEEVESLRWAAKGKTAWESARIQSISERAVIHRLRRAREKLGASSTALAVRTATLLGHIEPF